VSGNAQRRKRDHILFHGTLMHGFDLNAIGVYLKEPPRQPGYRERRPHRDFVSNLAVPAPDLKRAITAAWGDPPRAPGWPRTETARLVAEKYARDEWNRVL
jgi:lipoate-protein ligase A